MKKIKGQYRQGDVLLEEVAKLPASAKRVKPKNGKIVLAEGEVTGHAHTIDADTADWWKDGEDDFVSVSAKPKVAPVLRHQEHGPIMLPHGRAVRKVTQREYTATAIRNVAD
jgi:hypothetical protein